MRRKNRTTVVRTLRDVKSIRPRYSGELSFPFWRRIHHLPDASRWRLYSMGCVLQSMENMAIAELEAAEERARK